MLTKPILPELLYRKSLSNHLGKTNCFPSITERTGCASAESVGQGCGTGEQGPRN